MANLQKKTLTDDCGNIAFNTGYKKYFTEPMNTVSNNINLKVQKYSTGFGQLDEDEFNSYENKGENVNVQDY